MFRTIDTENSQTIAICVEGESFDVPQGVSVAAALLFVRKALRTTSVSDSPRAPYCMMGNCFDCLVEIDGVPNRQGCMEIVRAGMEIRQQRGKVGLE